MNLHFRTLNSALSANGRAAFKGSCCLWSSSQWHHVSGFLVQRSVLQGPSAQSVSAVCMHTLRRTSACYVSIGGGVELLCKGRKGLMVGRYLSVPCVPASSCLCFSILKAHPVSIYITECSQGISSHQSLEKGLTPTLVHWFSISNPSPTDKTQHKLSYRLRAMYKTLLRAKGTLLNDFLGYYHF